jgi:Xaa-Pro aminopeptidase
MWTDEQIKDHKKAAELLLKIKDKTIDLLKNNKNITEKEASDFILNQFEKNNLKRDIDAPIVAFGKNTDRPHYFPKENSKKLEKGDIIIIDLWAKLNKADAPFADITWVVFYGENFSLEMKNVFEAVRKARDSCLSLIKEKLKIKEIPSGHEIDQVACEEIIKAGYGAGIMHTTGHSLGIIGVHGPEKNCPRKDSQEQLSKNLGYTIEPGIYLKDRFGVRLEMDFYISDKMELVITTEMQNEIVMI